MTYTRLFDIIHYQAAKFPKNDAICGKEDGIWKKYSTPEIIDIINKLSVGLLEFGVEKDDKIAIISNNRPEWNFVDFGMFQAGCINVPIYPTITVEDYKFIFNDAKVKIAFVSDQDLHYKINSIKDEVSTLKKIYSFDQIPGVPHWTELLGTVTDDKLKQIDEIKGKIRPEDLATLIYTSGTTGKPKGVMLSHKNIVSNVEATASCLPLNESNRVLSFLPLSHIFERMVTYTYMSLGVSIYYAESMETIGENIKEVKPHFFSSVPRLLEKVYDKIVNKGSELSGIKKKLFFWALELGLKYDNKGKNGFWYNKQLSVARKLIFSKWQEALGGELVGIVTGSAALQPRLAKVFSAAGIMVREGYGLTETSPVLCFNRFEDDGYYFGTVGLPIPSVDIKIAEDGEILAKGPNIMMGYFNRQDLTDEVIDKDGWFHTGDIGEFVDGSFLKITDRKKEMFKTSQGKYVAPQPIENKMKESRFIEQIMVVGENKKFAAALVVPAFEVLKEWCHRKGIQCNSPLEIAENQRVKERIMKDIEKLNQNFGRHEQIKKIEIIPHEWTIEGGEMTPTLKYKRKAIEAKYKLMIERIYQSED